MDMCISRWLLQIVILIIYLPKNYGNIISFGTDEPVSIPNSITLICKISGFSGTADLKRNGGIINSCSDVNFCTFGPSRNISNAVFTFAGNSFGIEVTINPLLDDEVGMSYVCSYNGNDKEYNITLSKSPEESSNDNTGPIAGGVVGGVVVLTGIGGTAVAVYARTNKHKKVSSDDENRTEEDSEKEPQKDDSSLNSYVGGDVAQNPPARLKPIDQVTRKKKKRKKKKEKK